MNNSTHRIRLLATSDIHGYIYPYNYGDGKEENHGLARVFTRIQKLRDENTLLIDNGDVLEGSPLMFYHLHFNQDEVNPMAKCLKYMNYDYMNIGNHDFNYGIEILKKHIEDSEVPCLTYNMVIDGKRIGPQYVIREMCGKKIALFGLCTQYIPHWEAPSNIEGAVFIDAYECAKETVELIKEKENPDYIICVYHGGFERNLETGQLISETNENEGYRMMEEIEGIDVLISGHSHRSYCGKKFNTVYTQTLSEGKELACIDIDVETGEITAEVLSIDDEPDEGLMQVTQAEEDTCQEWLDQVLGTTKIDLHLTNEFDDCFNKSQVITFFNQITLDYTGADLAANSVFTNGGGFDETITMRDIVRTYVFANTLVVKELTGKVLKEYLERIAEFWTIRDGEITPSDLFRYPRTLYFDYDMLDGIDYTIKVSNPVGSRIIELLYQGKPISDDQVFSIVINNYRAAGGEFFPMIKNAPTLKEISTSMVEIIAEYILNHKVINFEPVHNIKIIP